MISIDTNVLVRLLTGDDEMQAGKARELFEHERIYITKTVMLETEWVLRHAYDNSGQSIAEAFMTLSGQENVTIEDARHVVQATALLLKGMDFADALHLCCSGNVPFATFDRKLQARAVDAGHDTVRLL